MSDSVLDEASRSKLDSIVSQMHTNGESDANIQAVVDDFKSKYAPKARSLGIGTSMSATPRTERAIPGTDTSVGDIGRGLKQHGDEIYHALPMAAAAAAAGAALPMAAPLLASPEAAGVITGGRTLYETGDPIKALEYGALAYGGGKGAGALLGKLGFGPAAAIEAKAASDKATRTGMAMARAQDAAIKENLSRSAAAALQARLGHMIRAATRTASADAAAATTTGTALSAEAKALATQAPKLRLVVPAATEAAPAAVEATAPEITAAAKAVKPEPSRLGWSYKDARGSTPKTAAEIQRANKMIQAQADGAIKAVGEWRAAGMSAEAIAEGLSNYGLPEAAVKMILKAHGLLGE